MSGTRRGNRGSAETAAEGCPDRVATGALPSDRARRLRSGVGIDCTARGRGDSLWAGRSGGCAPRRPRSRLSVHVEPGLLADDHRLLRAVSGRLEPGLPHLDRERGTDHGLDQPAGIGGLRYHRRDLARRGPEPGDRDLRAESRRRPGYNPVLGPLPPAGLPHPPGQPGRAGLAGMDARLLLHRQPHEFQRCVLRHGARRERGPGVVPEAAGGLGGCDERGAADQRHHRLVAGRWPWVRCRGQHQRLQRVQPRHADDHRVAPGRGDAHRSSRAHAIAQRGPHDDLDPTRGAGPFRPRRRQRATWPRRMRTTRSSTAWSRR